MTLKPIDAHFLACIIAGVEPENSKHVSPLALIAANAIKAAGTNPREIRNILGEYFSLVMDMDPSEAPEPAREREEAVRIVPELDKAKLTDEHLRLAESGGKWVKDYVRWGRGIANQTPENFHLAAGLWMAGLPLGRRVFIHTHFDGPIYASNYHLILAISTYYRKSTGFKKAAELVRKHAPHLLISPPQTPEAFLEMLSGKMPSNYSDLPGYVQKMLSDGQRWAAQRGLIRDEMSAIFKGMGTRDYMSGLKELFMEVWDCPDSIEQHTKSSGLLVVRNIATSIIGASTPAEMSIAVADGDWRNGNLARFCLWTPEENYSEAQPTEYREPSELMQVWKTVLGALPEPPEVSLMNDDDSRGKQEALAAGMASGVWKAFATYEHELRQFTAPESGLDDRLRAQYGRLHIHALKFALISATFNWAAGSHGKPSGSPVVSLSDWYWAQTLTEQLRHGAHAVLSELGQTSEMRLEDRILGLLRRNASGLSLRNIYRSLTTQKKKTEESLKALITEGLVVEIPDTNAGSDGVGRTTNHYMLVDFVE